MRKNIHIYNEKKLKNLFMADSKHSMILSSLIAIRHYAKINKQYDIADKIRDEIFESNYKITDIKNNTYRVDNKSHELIQFEYENGNTDVYFKFNHQEGYDDIEYCIVMPVKYFLEAYKNNEKHYFNTSEDSCITSEILLETSLKYLKTLGLEYDNIIHVTDY